MTFIYDILSSQTDLTRRTYAITSLISRLFSTPHKDNLQASIVACQSVLFPMLLLAIIYFKNVQSSQCVLWQP